MKDWFTLGVLVGATAQLIMLPIELAAEILNWAARSNITVAAGIFFGTMGNTLAGMILGSFGTLIIAGILGVVLVLLLLWTKKDFWWLKGPFVGTSAWIAFWGILVNPGIVDIVPKDIASSVLALVIYLAWGALAGYFALRWGDRNLFSRGR